MKGGRRASDSTFELNLAPFLDIIVSIIPMLLLSVAFVQIKMIESPTPQVVSEQTAKTPPKPETSITLKVSKVHGFMFEVVDTKGKTSKSKVGLANGQLDFAGLQAFAVQLKELHPEVTGLQLSPDENISFDELVKVMDTVRQKPRPKPTTKVSITDMKASAPSEDSYLFPDVIFASVGG